MCKKYAIIVGALMTQCTLNQMVYSCDGVPVVPGNVDHDGQINGPSNDALPFLWPEEESEDVSSEDSRQNSDKGEDSESESSGEDNEEILRKITEMINEFIRTFICNRNIMDIVSLNGMVVNATLGSLVKGEGTFLSGFFAELRQALLNNIIGDYEFCYGRYAREKCKIIAIVNALAHENIPESIKDLYVTVGDNQLSFEHFINLLITADDSAINQYVSTMINAFLKRKGVEPRSKGDEIQWQCFDYNEFKKIKQGMSKDEFMPEAFLSFMTNCPFEFSGESYYRGNFHRTYSDRIDIFVQNFRDRLMAFELAYFVNESSSDVGSAVREQLAMEVVNLRLNWTDNPDNIMNHMPIPDEYKKIACSYIDAKSDGKIKEFEDEINGTFDKIINVASQKACEMITNFMDTNSITDDNMVDSEVGKLRAHAMPISLKAQRALKVPMNVYSNTNFPVVTLYPTSLPVSVEFLDKLYCSYEKAIELYVRDLINSFLVKHNMNMSCPDWNCTNSYRTELINAIASLGPREDSSLCDKFCKYIDDDILMFGQSLDRNCVNEIGARIRRFSCRFEHRLNYCEDEVKISQIIDEIEKENTLANCLNILENDGELPSSLLGNEVDRLVSTSSSGYDKLSELWESLLATEAEAKLQFEAKRYTEDIKHMKNIDIVRDALKRIHNKEPLISEIIEENSIIVDPANLEILIEAEECAKGQLEIVNNAAKNNASN